MKVHPKYLLLILFSLVLIAQWGFAPDKGDKMSKEKLGELLFFDPILSADSTISCASCHKPEFAFADTLAFSIGVGGRLGKRNAPSVMNMSDRESFFWDGRAATLEAQAIFPIEDPNEMNLPIGTAIARLNKSQKYRSLFRNVFGKAPDKQNLGLALAAFERTLETTDTPLDRWQNDEQKDTLNPQEIRGRELFFSKAKCIECHFTGDFTGDEFRGIGLFDGKKHNDSGRYIISKKKADIGRFKVPGLRNIAMTAPYMHDGSMKSLREVIDYYDNPGKLLPNGLNRDSVLLEPLGLTEQEKQDLEAFLQALTDDRFRKLN
jgi:cytochrome c peroxidase